MKSFHRAATAALAVSCAGLASAQFVAYDNFGPGDTFQTGIGYTISEGAPVNVDNDQGDIFTAAVGGQVSRITVAMGYVTGVNQATITLHADNNGTVGNQLGSWTISDMGRFGSAYSPSVINVGGAVSITANTRYWLIASSANPSWLAWNYNNQGRVDRHANRQNLGAWNYSQSTQGAFRVEIVPEPATMVALGAGLAALAARRRKA